MATGFLPEQAAFNSNATHLKTPDDSRFIRGLRLSIGFCACVKGVNAMGRPFIAR